MAVEPVFQDFLPFHGQLTYKKPQIFDRLILSHHTSHQLIGKDLDLLRLGLDQGNIFPRLLLAEGFLLLKKRCAGNHGSQRRADIVG